MKTVFINASPKKRSSNSSYFSSIPAAFTGDNTIQVPFRRTRDYPQVIRSLAGADSLVLALPVYVDAVPSHVLSLLERLNDAYRMNPAPLKVYAIVNCGFYEGNQCESTLEMLECWCRQSGFEWGGGIGIGAGEMLGFIRILPIFAFLKLSVLYLAYSISPATPIPPVNFISVAICLLLFLAFSFGAWFHLILLGLNVRRGKNHSIRFTSVTCCPRICFQLFANIYWILRALLYAVPVWKMLRK